MRVGRGETPAWVGCGLWGGTFTYEPVVLLKRRMLQRICSESHECRLRHRGVPLLYTTGMCRWP